ncbi:MAG: cysteine methyltransferase [Rhodospirillaceae bacterium]|nr:cysteine methyltransferase [Rhodospirillaceae bacterium]|tara:strand:+ start:609 stop:1139 length:531 start_codon:yes stop_codon:yes gene_type:complete
MKLVYDEIESPIGIVLLILRDDAVCTLDFSDCADRSRRLLTTRFGAVEPVRAAKRPSASERVSAYFAGEVDALDDITVAAGGTPFQEQVWAALRRIPAGQTATYGNIAAAIGSPKAMRAVGMANNRNPIALIVPCHRVIGADGSLTGYAGGLDRKRWLLEHEGALLPMGGALAASA